MRHAVIVAFLLLAGTAGASAQLFNPNTPAGPAPIIPPVPPQAQPGFNPQPPPVATDARSNPLARTPDIRLGAPARETHQDKSIRCTQSAAQLGIPSGAVGSYVGQCVTQ